MTLYDVTASMQIDAQKIEAMPLTITVTMSVAAWRRLMDVIHTGPHHTTNIAVEWSIRGALEHVDKATAHAMRFRNGHEVTP